MNAREIRGRNHLPVSATGSHNFRVFLTQTRGGTWDPEIYRSEIEYVASHGLKQLRLFWSPYAYFVNKAAVAQCVRDAAEMVRDASLEVMSVCTDAVSASAVRVEAHGLLGRQVHGAQASEIFDLHLQSRFDRRSVSISEKVHPTMVPNRPRAERCWHGRLKTSAGGDRVPRVGSEDPIAAD